MSARRADSNLPQSRQELSAEEDPDGNMNPNVIQLFNTDILGCWDNLLRSLFCLVLAPCVIIVQFIMLVTRIHAAGFVGFLYCVPAIVLTTASIKVNIGFFKNQQAAAPPRRRSSGWAGGRDFGRSAGPAVGRASGRTRCSAHAAHNTLTAHLCRPTTPCRRQLTPRRFLPMPHPSPPADLVLAPSSDNAKARWSAHEGLRLGAAALAGRPSCACRPRRP